MTDVAIQLQPPQEPQDRRTRSGRDTRCCIHFHTQSHYYDLLVGLASWNRRQGRANERCERADAIVSVQFGTSSASAGVSMTSDVPRLDGSKRDRGIKTRDRELNPELVVLHSLCCT